MESFSVLKQIYFASRQDANKVKPKTFAGWLLWACAEV